MSTIPQEEVLVIPRSLLEQAGMFQGFCGEVDRYLSMILRRPAGCRGRQLKKTRRSSS